MAVSVDNLYKSALPHYMMQLVAGGSGIQNLVQWVHVAEDKNVVHFIRGNEMIFTTGINSKSANWLFDFAKNLHKQGVSAIVLNIGAHIHDIPQEVKDFCDDVSLPLFTIPWATKIASMTRDFGKLILMSEKMEAGIASTMKDLLFHIGSRRENLLILERNGFLSGRRYCFACISSNEADTEDDDRLNKEHRETEFFASIPAKGLRDRILSFRYDNKMIIMFADYSAADISRFLDEYMETLIKRGWGGRIHIGVSENIAGLEEQEDNFKAALTANRIAQKQNQGIIYYENQDLYRLLYAVSDKDHLRDFYNRTLGKLQQYDEINGTSLLPFLRLYIESNNNHQLIAEKLYMHRNTVANQLKKIAKITGFDALDLKSEFQYLLAFYIQDIL